MVTTTLQFDLNGAVHALPVGGDADPRYELDAWDTAIRDLDDALGTILAARRELDRLGRTLETIEAGHVLAVEGKNAEERKARLVLALNDDRRYTDTVAAIECERSRLAEADRRAAITKERCRLLRAAVALATSIQDQ